MTTVASMRIAALPRPTGPAGFRIFGEQEDSNDEITQGAQRRAAPLRQGPGKVKPLMRSPSVEAGRTGRTQKSSSNPRFSLPVRLRRARAAGAGAAVAERRKCAVAQASSIDAAFCVACTSPDDDRSCPHWRSVAPAVFQRDRSGTFSICAGLRSSRRRARGCGLCRIAGR